MLHLLQRKRRGAAVLGIAIVVLVLLGMYSFSLMINAWNEGRHEAWEAERRNMHLLALSTAHSLMRGISSDVSSTTLSAIKAADFTYTKVNIDGVSWDLCVISKDLTPVLKLSEDIRLEAWLAVKSKDSADISSGPLYIITKAVNTVTSAERTVEGRMVKSGSSWNVTWGVVTK